MSPSESAPDGNTSAPLVTFPPLVDRAVVVTGPTASGKSGVAIELARRVGGEILSLDSIAVYVGMDIGTAKPTAEQRRRIPHHLLDLVPPTEDFSVARYLRAAHAAVDEVTRRGRLPIFVGGTPLFLKGVLRGFDPGPPADWEFRRRVEEDIERHGLEALRGRLRQVDPLAAHRIGPNDKRRMIRALEYVRATGVPISHRQTQFERSRPADSCLVFCLRHPRARLHERVNRRVDAMFERGLVDEVRGLAERYGQLSRTARQAVGYREVLRRIDQGGDLDETRRDVAAHTRQLARRQETWFRSFRELRAIDVEPELGTDDRGGTDSRGETGSRGGTVDQIAAKIADEIAKTNAAAKPAADINPSSATAPSSATSQPPKDATSTREPNRPDRLVGNSGRAV